VLEEITVFLETHIHHEFNNALSECIYIPLYVLLYGHLYATSRSFWRPLKLADQKRLGTRGRKLF